MAGCISVAGLPSTNWPAAAAAENVRLRALISGWPGRKPTITYTTGMPAPRAAVIACDSRSR